MKCELFLATTAIDEFWDDSKTIVFLGEWCRLYNKKQLWENLDSETVPFYWDSTEKTEKGILYCQSVLERFYRQITKVLNEYHGLDKDERFYKLLLGTWPFHFIHQLYDKYLHLKKVKTMYPKIDTWLLNPEQHYIPMDYTNYCDVSLNHGDDRYQLQIYSDITEILGFSASRRKLKSPLIQQSSYKSKKKNLSARNVRNVIAGFSLGKNPVCISGVDLSARDYMSLWTKLYGNIYIDNFDLDLDVNMNVDRKYRNEVNLGLDADEFEIVLSSIIMKHIPLLLLEGLRQIAEQVLSRMRKSSVSLLTMQLGNNTARNIYLANKCGEISIYGIQHGGGYGVDRLNQHELYERDVSDIFFTAGWGNGKKTKSLSNIKFMPRNLSSNKAEDILFCLNDLPRYVYRLHFVPMGSMCNKVYLPDAVSFANQIKNRKHLILRLYPDPAVYGNCTDERIKNELPEVRFDDGKRSFISALSASRLFVSNFFNTTILEALANNVPSVVFVNRNIMAFSDESLPYIEKLYDVGLLQTSPDTAANFVDKIYDDVWSWWQSQPVQEARSSFIEKYAYCGKNWAGEWRDVLKSLGK